MGRIEGFRLIPTYAAAYAYAVITPLFFLAWGTPLLAPAALGLGLYVGGIAESEETAAAAIRHAVIIGALAGVAFGALFGLASGRLTDTIVAGILGASLSGAYVAKAARNQPRIPA
jgi:hypothetical protein